MSMKKTDLEKHLAKKIDGRMKSGIAPQRFGQGSNLTAAQAASKPKIATPKLVPIACKLPAELANRLRLRTVTLEGGMNAAITQAVELWLNSIPAGVIANAA